MTATGSHQRTIGWIGTGRMGFALASRLLEHGCDLSVYNRTRAKSEPLAARGARLVDRPADLSDRDIVLTSVAGSKDFAEVMTGPHGLLGNGTRVPSIVIDTSTVSMDASRAIRGTAERLGSALLAAPVSGNPKVARAGKLSLAVSGPRPAFEQALPYLQMLGQSVTYVGEGEAARLVKICHNLILGVVTQILAETTVLAERGGIARADYLEFINGSVMGSIFSRYKTPAFVNLDFTPTFTGHLLCKDFELGARGSRGQPGAEARASRRLRRSRSCGWYEGRGLKSLCRSGAALLPRSAPASASPPHPYSTALQTFAPDRAG